MGCNKNPFPLVTDKTNKGFIKNRTNELGSKDKDSNYRH